MLGPGLSLLRSAWLRGLQFRQANAVALAFLAAAAADTPPHHGQTCSRRCSIAAAATSPAASSAATSSNTTTVPVERLQHAVTPQVCEHLQRRGFAVLDGVFGPEAAAALRAEVAAARRHMHKNHTHLVTPQGTGLLEKAHIWEAELMMPDTQALAPLCSQLQHDATLRVMLSLLMPGLSLQSQAIKLQWNAGSGGCFPMHFDTDAALDGRRLTAIWYLNPGWRPGDGGELRLYPFPEAPIDIQPLNDRMVLFSSPHMLHRVLPSTAERFCFTIWLSEGGAGRRRANGGTGGGAAAGGRTAVREREEMRRALSREEDLSGEEAWRMMLHPDMRKHAAKWLYRTEWEQSLRESHGEGAALQQALHTFHWELDVVRRALAPVLPILEGGTPPEGALLQRTWF